MPNTQWRIAYGDYDFAIDRQTLAYSLTETKTGTVWADGLSTGWIELEERESGVRTRYNFSDAKLISVAEKSSHQGKRILFGLDLLGIPIDLYFICSEKEIQLTVEANRDTKTHKVQDVGLLPGLVSVPDDGASYLVAPRYEGELIYASDVYPEKITWPVWNFIDGLSMPFVGAIRRDTTGHSALSLISDSAYSAFDLERQTHSRAVLDLRFERDPERRRLDVRVLLTPQGNYISVASNYRDKLITDRNHITLRRKIRDAPALDNLLGTVMIELSAERGSGAWVAIRFLKDLGQSKMHPIFFVDETGYSRFKFTEAMNLDSARALSESIAYIKESGYSIAALHLSDAYNINVGWADNDFRELPDKLPSEELDFNILKDDLGVDAVVLGESASFPLNLQNRWDDLQIRMDRFSSVVDHGMLVGADASVCDWSVSGLHFADLIVGRRRRDREKFRTVPLFNVIYRDCILGFYGVGSGDASFLDVLLRLGLPRMTVFHHGLMSLDEQVVEFLRISRILPHLHRLTFSAFITGHRFVTSDIMVEEATYSDKTYVAINRSETKTYKRQEFDLPPGGFYVRHAQMEAHYALRVGDVTFDKPAWRIRRSRDGRPLETSEDVLYQEFPV